MFWVQVPEKLLGWEIVQEGGDLLMFAVNLLLEKWVWGGVGVELGWSWGGVGVGLGWGWGGVGLG